ncbi:hypothetical protein FRC09_003132 [Ceratobasidium sp. 395]|nr:hypothetical protein FRC09_003132 [Ceratobasidium sp. 395]
MSASPHPEMPVRLKRILRFDPGRIYPGPTMYRQRKALKRYLGQMGIQHSNRNGTDLLELLRRGVVEMDRLGIELWFQPEGTDGLKDEDIPVTRVSDEVLQVLRSSRNMRPYRMKNKSILATALKNKGRSGLLLRLVCADSLFCPVIVPGFYLEQFMGQSRPPKIKDGGPFVPGAPEIVLKRRDGPRAVVSEDMYILIIYCPEYLEAESQILMRETLEDFTNLVPPKPDTRSGDRRAQVLPHLNTPDSVRGKTPAKRVEKDWAEYLGEPAPDSVAEEEEEPWKAPYPNSHPLSDPPELDKMDPASLHHCINWIARGQQGKKPPVVSTELRAALKNEESTAAFIALHLGKFLTDQCLNDLVRLFHPTFYRLLCQLRDKLFNADNPPPVSWDVWSSIFTFQSIGFNRQTRMHRDAAGMHGGLDVLFLLGDHRGGRMKWQDLNVKAEWLPGDLCAFDGKVFSHGIENWVGNKRYCFIYFVHRNVFKHFGLPDSCCFPSVAELEVTLGMRDDSDAMDESA